MEVNVKIQWKYKDQSGEAIDTFGYPEFNPINPDQMTGLFFWYEEGNGSCDCNRSRICGLPEMKCGEEIKFIKIEPLTN